MIKFMLNIKILKTIGILFAFTLFLLFTDSFVFALSPFGGGSPPSFEFSPSTPSGFPVNTFNDRNSGSQNTSSQNITFGFGDETVVQLGLPTITHIDNLGDIIDFGEIDITPLNVLREMLQETGGSTSVAEDQIDGTLTETGYNAAGEELYKATAKLDGDGNLDVAITLLKEPFVLENVLGKNYELDEMEITVSESGDWTLEGSKDGEKKLAIEHFAQAKSKEIGGEKFQGISTIVTTFGGEDREENNLVSRETAFNDEGKPVYQKDEYETPVEVTTEEGETLPVTTKLVSYKGDGSRTISYFNQNGDIVAQENVTGDTFRAAAGPGESSSGESPAGGQSDNPQTATPSLSPQIPQLVTTQSATGVDDNTRITESPGTVDTPSTTIPDLTQPTTVSDTPDSSDILGSNSTNDILNPGFESASVSNNTAINENQITTSPFVDNKIALITTTETTNVTFQEKIEEQNNPAIVLANLPKNYSTSSVAVYKEKTEAAKQTPDVKDEIKTTSSTSGSKGETETITPARLSTSSIGLTEESKQTESEKEENPLVEGNAQSKNKLSKKKGKQVVSSQSEEEVIQNEDGELLPQTTEEVKSLSSVSKTLVSKYNISLEEAEKLLSTNAAEKIMKLLTSRNAKEILFVSDSEITFVTGDGTVDKIELSD